MEDKINKLIYLTELQNKLLQELVDIQKGKNITKDKSIDKPTKLKEYYSLHELEILLSKLQKSKLNEKQLEFVKKIHNFALQYNRVTSKQYQSIVNLL